MTTTASRSRDHMRSRGYEAECVEHRRGNRRFDLFGFADVIAYSEKSGIILIQAYHKKDTKIHENMTPKRNKKIQKWISAGGVFQHHIWSFRQKNKRKFWKVNIIEFV